MSRWARLGSVAVLAAAISWAVGAAPSPTAAAPLTSCSTTRGTVIAVDFGHWSGPIIRGCGVQPDGQPDSSPYELLSDGGFTTAGTTHDGPAFICRLGNAAFEGGTQYPTPTEDHCVVTPPASAYWSYWLAAPGATTWTYATMSQPLPSGGVAYWEFGSGQTPSGSLINQLRAHNVTPPPGGAAPTTPPAVGSAPAGSGPTATHASSTATAAAPRSGNLATGTSSLAAGATPTTPVSQGAADAAGTPDSTRVVSSVAPAKQASGSAVPIVVTVAVVAVLGAAGGVSLVRRRRREQS